MQESASGIIHTMKLLEVHMWPISRLYMLHRRVYILRMQRRHLFEEIQEADRIT